MIGRAALGAILVLSLGAIAWLSPWPDRQTDRDIYEATAERLVVPDCADIHCFRVLVAWGLGPLPGPSGVKWKTYAVVSVAASALAVLALCRTWGLPAPAGLFAAVATAFGFGSLYTLHDPYTSDPLMYLIGPVLALLLAHGRLAIAGTVAAAGVLAKEFAAAPMLVFAAAAWLGGRRALAMRVLAAGNVALIVWLLLQLVLVIGFNYSYGNNSSTHLLSGGYLATWLSGQTARGAASALYGEFGALWLLVPAGFFLAPADVRRFALAAVPAALVFGYVQQPDRALWNFHFLATPLAALVLAAAPPALAWSTLGMFVLANLRIGAQLTFVPASRVALVVSGALAVACIYAAWRPGVAAARSTP